VRDVQVLLDEADARLYSIKETGRDRLLVDALSDDLTNVRERAPSGARTER
jgi:hypothetical protein